MNELVIFAVCAAPFALIIFVMVMRRKTHCWECGAPNDGREPCAFDGCGLRFIDPPSNDGVDSSEQPRKGAAEQ